MRHFLTYTFAFFAGMVLILTGMQVLGSLTPPSTLAVFVPQHCSPHPCWYGIQPGKTSIQQARAILDTSAMSPSKYKYQVCAEGDACWKVTVSASGGDPSSLIDQIRLDGTPKQLRLGDLIALYGSPTSATLCWVITPTNGGISNDVPRPLMVGNIVFPGHVQVFVYNAEEPTARRFDPNMLVDNINFKSLPDASAPQWRGFQTVSALNCGR